MIPGHPHRVFDEGLQSASLQETLRSHLAEVMVAGVTESQGQINRECGPHWGRPLLGIHSMRSGEDPGPENARFTRPEHGQARESCDKVMVKSAVEQAEQGTHLDRNSMGRQDMRDRAEEIESKNYGLRKALPGDSRRVWEIRNHPLARRFSPNQEEIPFSSHETWFTEKYLCDQGNHCLVLSDDEHKVIGYGRFDYDGKNDNYTVSIALDADYHGRGIGHYLLKELLRQFRTDKDILAVIQRDNPRSRRLFKKNNFQRARADKENDYLVYKRDQ